MALHLTPRHEVVLRKCCSELSAALARSEPAARPISPQMEEALAALQALLDAGEVRGARGRMPADRTLEVLRGARAAVVRAEASGWGGSKEQRACLQKIAGVVLRQR